MTENHNYTHPDPHHDMYSKTIFGFWLFLLTDFVLFGSFFATFAVLAKSPYPSPKAIELFNLDYALVQSFLMLLCAFFSGLGGVAAHRKNKKMTIVFFVVTFFLSAIFMTYEFFDFQRLLQAGYGWNKTGFLSAFYTILATHGVHVIFGLIWIIVLLVPLIKEEIGHESIRRLTCLRMFFQFLNIVWIFIFSIVYFMGRGGI